MLLIFYEIKQLKSNFTSEKCITSLLEIKLYIIIIITQYLYIILYYIKLFSQRIGKFKYYLCNPWIIFLQYIFILNTEIFPLYVFLFTKTCLFLFKQFCDTLMFQFFQYYLIGRNIYVFHINFLSFIKQQRCSPRKKIQSRLKKINKLKAK